MATRVIPGTGELPSTTITIISSSGITENSVKEQSDVVFFKYCFLVNIADKEREV